MKVEFKNNPLYSNHSFLENVWGDQKDSYIKALSWDTQNTSAPSQFWLTFPAHGYLMADTYKRPVVLFSKQIPCTFLPLSYSPTTHSPICLILLSDLLHFISFEFKAELWPSPKLDPFWKSYVQEEAVAWKDFIQANLDLGEYLLFPKR